MKNHIKIKDQKGISILEVLMASVIILVLIVSLVNYSFRKEDVQNLDEVAYSTASLMKEYAIPAQKYIDDNKNKVIPDRFNVDFLKSKGYINSDKNNVKLPDGRDIVFVSNNEYGFPLSIGMYASGKIDKNFFKRYSLDDEFKFLSFNEKVGSYLIKMVNDKNYEIGVVTPEYKFRWNRSMENDEFSLEPFIKKSTSRPSDEYFTALFFNLQEVPGYWVLNYTSKSFTDVNIAREGAENSLFSLGYSDFCATPNKTPETPIQNTDITDVETRSHTMGDNIKNIYICIPSSRISVKEGNYELPLFNDYFENIEKQGGCYINNAYANAIEFKVGNRYYSFQNISGRVIEQCYFPSLPTFHSYKMNIGRFNGNKIDSTVNFDNNYIPKFRDIQVNHIDLY